MKRLMTALLALLMTTVLFAGTLAETGVIQSVELTDVPNSHTADAVLSLESVFQNSRATVYDILKEPANQLTVDTLLDIFSFVVDDGNRPARYFPPETQQQIIEAIEGESLDSLNMTEFMRLSFAETRISEDLKFLMELDVDYMPGQTVVVVVADTADTENLVWFALKAEVVSPGLIEVIIPKEVFVVLEGKDVLYSLLTPRRGMTRYYLQEEVITPEPLPSIEADDTSYIDRTVISEDLGEVEFSLVIVEETDIQVKELANLREHVKKQPLIDWFPKEDQQEVQLLLGGNFDLDTLILYDALSLESIDYKDTYGDVLASFHFVTPYAKEQAIIAMLGIPKDEKVTGMRTAMDWAVQLVRVQDGGAIDIAFDQLMMIEIGEQSGLLLLLAEPLTR